MDLNLVNLSVDLDGKDLQRCTSEVEMFKTVPYFSVIMDPGLYNLHVNSYDKKLYHRGGNI